MFPAHKRLTDLALYYESRLPNPQKIADWLCHFLLTMTGCGLCTRSQIKAPPTGEDASEDPILYCIYIIYIIYTVLVLYIHYIYNVVYTYILYIQYRPKVWTHLLIQCVSFIFMTIYIVDSHWRHQNWMNEHIWNYVLNKKVWNNSKYVLYFRFLKVATLCFFDTIFLNKC